MKAYLSGGMENAPDLGRAWRADISRWLSDELGHEQMLKYLQADTIVSLRMCLGEGTGSAVVLPILRSAVAFLDEMASFESAHISGKNG